MALSQVYTAVAGHTITADRWNNEFGNIYGNGTDLAFPLTKAVSFAGYTITWDAAAVTTIGSSASQAWQMTPGAKSGTPSTTGALINVVASTYTDSNTAGSGTATAFAAHAIQRPTLAATNASVVTTDAATLYIANAPAAGTNETLTNAWALWVDDGAIRLDGGIALQDSRTATAATPLTVIATTTGTPATGIGTGILFRAESQDESPSDFGQIEFDASDVNSGTEDTYFQVLLRSAGAALSPSYRFGATGATPSTAIFTHANASARTYTLPNNTQSLAGLTTILADTSLPAANNVDITNIPQTFAALVLNIQGASSDTTTRFVEILTSVDNGSTFSSDGHYGNYITNTTAAADTNTAFCAHGLTQTNGQVTSLIVVLHGYQAGPALHTAWAGRYADGTSISGQTLGTTSGVNALRIIWDGTGNFDAGTYALYGVS